MPIEEPERLSNVVLVGPSGETLHRYSAGDRILDFQIYDSSPEGNYRLKRGDAVIIQVFAHRSRPWQPTWVASGMDMQICC